MAKDKKHASPDDAHDPTKHVPDDEVIVAPPKGSSKARFLMTFLLVIMLLTTFSVSNEVVACFSRGDSATKGYMSWNDPVEGQKSLRASEFIARKQALAKFRSILQGGMDTEHSDDQTASFILLSQLAQDAGVRVTDNELKKRIQEMFGTSDNYRGRLQQARMSTKDFEECLRNGLLVERYETLLASPLATPDPQEVEKMWKGRHQEYAFEYLELPATNLTDEATAQAPTGDALKTWFDAQSDAEKNKYKTPPMASAELVALSLEGEVKPDALFAKYPRPPDEDLELAAKDFYGGFGYVRYRRTTFKPEEIKKIEDLNEPFDTVKDIAKRDAPIYRSLTAWQQDLSARETKGETIDLAAEAKALGFVYQHDDKLRPREEWDKAEGPTAGRYVVDGVFSNPVGKLLPAIVVESKAFVFGRVLAREDSKMPEFAAIEAKVRDMWIRKKASELAVAKLEALRDKLGTRPDPNDKNALPFKPEADAEKFAAVAKEAGLEIKKRDFEEHFEKIAPEKMTPAETFLRNASQLYVLKEGSVDKAAAAADASTAYLVRVAGVRDPAASKMSPNELQQIGRQLSAESVKNFESASFANIESMKERYALDLESWHREKKSSAD
jgi:hypothetical protein